MRVVERVVALQGYDISLLITNFHLQKLVKVKVRQDSYSQHLQLWAQVIDFVCEFISDIYADIMEIKLALNTRGRAVATTFLESFSAQ